MKLDVARARVTGSVAILMILGAMSVSASFDHVPQRVVSSDVIQLDRETGLRMLGHTPYSGYTVEEGPEGRLRERAGFLDGRRQGLRERWYADGTVSARTPYLDGRRHGVARTWWEDGTLRSKTTLVHGVPHGTQLQWYRSGALFKKTHLVQGREQGLQQAWRENGAIYNNYEALNGRIFGLRRSKLCFQLRQEELLP